MGPKKKWYGHPSQNGNPFYPMAVTVIPFCLSIDDHPQIMQQFIQVLTMAMGMDPKMEVLYHIRPYFVVIFPLTMASFGVDVLVLTIQAFHVDVYHRDDSSLWISEGLVRKVLPRTLIIRCQVTKW